MTMQAGSNWHLEKNVFSRFDQIPSGEADYAVTPGCLAIEGGAFRGLYAQGVVDALMLHGINFQTTVGVSAGALAGAGYVSGQIGHAARVNLGFRHDDRYIGLGAFLQSRSILNLNFAIRDFERYERFDYVRFYDPQRNFVAVATCLETGQPVFFERDSCSDIITAIQASASMPYMTPPVIIDGKPYLDGGCSCKIGYRWALERDFQPLVIIRTRDRSFRKKVSEKPSRLPAIYYRKYPAFVASLQSSNADYNHQCDEIEQLGNTGRAFVIYPSRPADVTRIEPDMEKLGELYELGLADGEDCMLALREYIARHS